MDESIAGHRHRSLRPDRTRRVVVLLGLDIVLRRVRLFFAQDVDLVFLLEPEVDEAHGLGPQTEAPARPPASHLGVAFAYPPEEFDVAGEAGDVDFAQALA